MNTKEVLKIALVSGVIFSLTVDSAFGTQGSDFVTAELSKQTDQVKNFLFGYVMPTAGVAGGVYGAINSYFSGSPKPFLMFGSVGLCSALIPQFIKSVFTMLLP